jgi:hypothetical protein
MYGLRLVLGVTNAIQEQGCLPASIRFRGRSRSAELECNCRGKVCELSGPFGLRRYCTSALHRPGSLRTRQRWVAQNYFTR